MKKSITTWIPLIVFAAIMTLEMKPHTKVYFDFFGYDTSDTILCEVCGKVAVDIHHINRRGIGGSKDKDVVTNLMALDRECHNKFGDKKQHLDMLNKVHLRHIEARMEEIKEHHKWLTVTQKSW